MYSKCSLQTGGNLLAHTSFYGEILLQSQFSRFCIHILFDVNYSSRTLHTSKLFVHGCVLLDFACVHTPLRAPWLFASLCFPPLAICFPLFSPLGPLAVCFPLLSPLGPLAVCFPLFPPLGPLAVCVPLFPPLGPLLPFAFPPWLFCEYMIGFVRVARQWENNHYSSLHSICLSQYVAIVLHDKWMFLFLLVYHMRLNT